jgi:hypothetical protein
MAKLKQLQITRQKLRLLPSIWGPGLPPLLRIVDNKGEYMRHSVVLGFDEINLSPYPDTHYKWRVAIRQYDNLAFQHWDWIGGHRELIVPEQSEV